MGSGRRRRIRRIRRSVGRSATAYRAGGYHGDPQRYPQRHGPRLTPQDRAGTGRICYLPDLSVLKYRDDYYRRGNPTGDDVLLVIEVADSSLALDLHTKLAKYARADIRRYWVVDLRHRTLHDHRDPDRFGRRYRQLHSLTVGDLSVDIEGVRVTVPLAQIFAD